jgi:hypothetical protein
MSGWWSREPVKDAGLPASPFGAGRPGGREVFRPWFHTSLLRLNKTSIRGSCGVYGNAMKGPRQDRDVLLVALQLADGTREPGISEG